MSDAEVLIGDQIIEVDLLGGDGPQGPAGNDGANGADGAPLAFGDITGLVTPTTRALLAALPTTGGAAYLREAGREGAFKWVAGNLSAKVTADPNQGVYVAPSSDTTGASGAWVRVLANSNVLRASHFGVSTSKTEAANKAILDSIIAAYLPGNITLIFPDGNVPCRVVIPERTELSLSTVTIKGETTPATWFGTVDIGYVMSTKGTILSSTGTAVFSGGFKGGVIECEYTGGFSQVRLAVEDLTIRTYDNPGQYGINAYRAQQFTARNVQVDTGVWSTAAADPTSGAARGIITPASNNGAFSHLQNIVVSGYSTGIWVGEHVVGDNIAIAACKYGLDMNNANHPNWFGRVQILRTQRPINASGVQRFRIEQLALERANSALDNANGGIDVPGNTAIGNGWQVTQVDLDDGASQLSGSIRFSAVLGGVGSEDTFTKNNGGNVSVVREGPHLSNVYNVRLTTPFSQPSSPSIFANIAAVSLVGASVIVPNRLCSITGAGRIQISEAGTFKITVNVIYAANATGYRYIDLRVGGVGTVRSFVLPATTAGAPATVSLEYVINPSSAPSEFWVAVDQNSGGALNITEVDVQVEQI